MKSFAIALLSFAAGLAAAPAQENTKAPPEMSPQQQQALMRSAEMIRKELATLNEYGVFDDLRFGIREGVVTLRGLASRPTLKSSAERVVQKLEGVKEVKNEIKVLPLSPNDDRLRTAVYLSIYRHPTLSRYAPGRNLPIFTSPAQFATGITNNPPIGFHPVHIIVENGNVTLKGVLDNEADSIIAEMQANSTPGVFSVNNEIQVPSRAKK